MNKKLIKNIILILIIIILSFQFIIGILSFKAVNDGKEPIWYHKKEVVKLEGEDEKTAYYIGLYKIVHLRKNNKITISLKAFFSN